MGPNVSWQPSAVVEAYSNDDMKWLVLQLELAASAGAAVIIAIIAIVVHAAISTGFPAIATGELPLYTLQVTFQCLCPCSHQASPPLPPTFFPSHCG